MNESDLRRGFRPWNRDWWQWEKKKKWYLAEIVMFIILGWGCITYLNLDLRIEKYKAENVALRARNHALKLKFARLKRENIMLKEDIELARMTREMRQRALDFLSKEKEDSSGQEPQQVSPEQREKNFEEVEKTIYQEIAHPSNGE